MQILPQIRGGCRKPEVRPDQVHGAFPCKRAIRLDSDELQQLERLPPIPAAIQDHAIAGLHRKTAEQSYA
jgi:hypothetical protein